MHNVAKKVSGQLVVKLDQFLVTRKLPNLLSIQAIVVVNGKGYNLSLLYKNLYLLIHNGFEITLPAGPGEYYLPSGAILTLEDR